MEKIVTSDVFEIVWISQQAEMCLWSQFPPNPAAHINYSSQSGMVTNPKGLKDKSKTRKVSNLTSWGGRGPESWFLDKPNKKLRAFRFPKLGGILPKKLLLERKSSIRPFRWPIIVAGNFPVSLLFWRKSDFKLVSSPMDGGRKVACQLVIYLVTKETSKSGVLKWKKECNRKVGFDW